MAIWIPGGATATNKPHRRFIRYAPDDGPVLRRRMLDRMRALLPNWNPQLEDLEKGQDYATAFIDAFVHLADVLAVYQDDHAAESFLRTAQREDSLMGLAELVAYRPAPGVAAASLQVFLLGPDKAFVIPAGQGLEGPPGDDGSPLIFETQASIAADFRLNTLRLFGHARSTRWFNVVGEAPVSRLRLAAQYAGLAAGTPLVFSLAGSNKKVVPLAAFWLEEEKTTIEWSSPQVLEGYHAPIADLEIRAKPAAEMIPVAAARADELRAGETRCAVANASLFNTPDSVGLIVVGGLMESVLVKTGGATIHWDRPLPISVRKSAARIYKASPLAVFPIEQTPSGYYVGSTRIGKGSVPLLTDVQPGDQLIIADDGGTLRAAVSGVSSQWIYLAERLPRRFFGWTAMYRVRIEGSGANPWTELTPELYPMGSTQLFVEGEVDGLEVGGTLVLGDGDEQSVHTLTNVAVVRKQTRLTFSPPTPAGLSLSRLRAWSRFGLLMRVDGWDHSEAFTAEGITELELETNVEGLEPGRHLVVSDADHAEGVRIHRIARTDHGIHVDFEPALRHAYAVGDAVVYGNVAPTQHGKTVRDELLGSGAKDRSRQTFELSQRPLTFVPDAATEGGAKPALELWVDGRRLTPVRDLAESGPDDPHFVVRTRRDERPTIIAGDGQHGMRLTSGRDNVRATYRVGLGAAGNVDPEAIGRAKPSPEGLDATFNAIAASGGEDREDVASIRRSVPLVAQTLDRAVTLSDYAMLARAFPGIAKARADWAADGLRRVVRLTVGAEGAVTATEALKASLTEYLQLRSTGTHRVSVVDFETVPLHVELRLAVASDYRRPEVQARFEAALRDRFFAYGVREFGGAAVLAEIYAMAEAMDGVDWVIAEAFHIEGAPTAVRHRVDIDGNALLTGGSPSDPEIGILIVRAEGGLS